MRGVCYPFRHWRILLDRRLHASMRRHTTTGWGLCPEHQRLHSEGFVALVECDPQRSGAPSDDGQIKPEQAYQPGCWPTSGVRRLLGCSTWRSRPISPSSSSNLA